MVRRRGLIAVLALAHCAAWATWSSTGSLYRGPCTHVGLRPATDGIGDYAMTVQISTDGPQCGRSLEGGVHP